jgi:hypothetical protein
MSEELRSKPSIRTLRDLRKALRSEDKLLSFPFIEQVDAWDTLVKYAGRDNGDDLTAQTLRRLEIRVADHHNMPLYRLGSKTLPEFLDMCRAAFSAVDVKPKETRARMGRPQRSDKDRDARLAAGWRACKGLTYKEGADELRRSIPNLTEQELRLAVDRQRKRPPK